MLLDISAVIKRFKKHYGTLRAYRNGTSQLHRAIDRAKCWTETCVYSCNLGKENLHEDFYRTVDADVERGNIKLQRKRTNQLTDVERKAISLVLRDDSAAKSVRETDEDTPKEMQL